MQRLFKGFGIIRNNSQQVLTKKQDKIKNRDK